MSRALRVAAFASLSAGGTALAGWWTVPVAAAVWVRLFASDRRPVRTTAMGAALGWAGLLGLGWVDGPITAVARCLSATLGWPPWGSPAATILYPVLLAGTAALLVKRAPAGG